MEYARVGYQRASYVLVNNSFLFLWPRGPLLAMDAPRPCCFVFVFFNSNQPRKTTEQTHFILHFVLRE